ncbi:MAG TPA: hypothetical protein VFL27_14940 [Candidatus Dormibacteraeota bacterium]|nr:hypothetical protein [Candidatus Dormibacteraeota bacterium]
MASSDSAELHFERSLDDAYDALERRLRAGPEAWLPGFSVEAGKVTCELWFEQAGRRISRRVELEAGPVQRFAYGVTVHVRWKAARHPELYPAFDGHLRLEARRQAGSMLRLDGRYTPPGGRLGATVDRAVMHHVAQSSVNDLLARVAERLVTSPARDAPNAGPPASSR